jgi:hypothetical protein
MEININGLFAPQGDTVINPSINYEFPEGTLHFPNTSVDTIPMEAFEEPDIKVDILSSGDLPRATKRTTKVVKV